jgi:hypothetical protein
MILREDLDGEREKEMVVSFLLRSLVPFGEHAVDLTGPRAKAKGRAPKRSRSPARSSSRRRSAATSLP